MTDAKVIVALDCENTKQALAIVEKLDPKFCRLKIGQQMFSLGGPVLVKALVKRGFDIFLDLKLHDSPDIVAKTVKVIAEMGIWMLSLHTSGGSEMMRAAVVALEELENKPLLVGITVLSTMQNPDLREVGQFNDSGDQVARLAALAKNSGLDGVICSDQEIKLVKHLCGQEFLTVVTAIRPEWIENPEKKGLIPSIKAVTFGTDYLVLDSSIIDVEVISEINELLKF